MVRSEMGTGTTPASGGILHRRRQATLVRLRPEEARKKPDAAGAAPKVPSPARTTPEVLKAAPSTPLDNAPEEAITEGAQSIFAARLRMLRLVIALQAEKAILHGRRPVLVRRTRTLAGAAAPTSVEAPEA